MKKGKVLFKVMMIMMVLWLGTISGNVQPVKAAAQTRGLVKSGSQYRYANKNGWVKNAWRTVNGDRYYFKSNGYAARHCSLKIGEYYYVFGANSKLLRKSVPTIVKAGSYQYLVDQKGRATTGWFNYKGRLYRASSTGKIYKNKVFDGITLTKKGYAKNDIACKLKLRTMEIVSQITNSSMTQSQKLYACWNYVTGGRMRYVSYFTGAYRSGSQRWAAYTMLTTGGGDCVNFACAFAALAYEVGYDPNIVVGGVPGSRRDTVNGLTSHAWVTINGAHYDPEGQWKGWNPGCYGTASQTISNVVLNVFKFTAPE